MTWTWTLEVLMESPDALDVPISPCQRAMCRIIDGLPLGELAERDDVIDLCGGVEAVAALANPTERPRECVVLGPVRSGKSQAAAAHSFVSALRVDLAMLRGGEVPRYSIVSAHVDNARATLDHLHGLMARPALKRYAAATTVDGVDIRRDDGRTVEVRVVAGHVAGASLVSRWSAGCTFDEAPRMGTRDKAVNLYDSRNALLGRLLPGAQILYVGSPWAPEGCVYDLFVEHFGKVGTDA